MNYVRCINKYDLCNLPSFLQLYNTLIINIIRNVLCTFIKYYESLDLISYFLNQYYLISSILAEFHIFITLSGI